MLSPGFGSSRRTNRLASSKGVLDCQMEERWWRFKIDSGIIGQFGLIRTMSFGPRRCVVHLEQIMGAPKDEGTRTVDEAARDESCQASSSGSGGQSWTFVLCFVDWVNLSTSPHVDCSHESWLPHPGFLLCPHVEISRDC